MGVRGTRVYRHKARLCPIYGKKDALMIGLSNTPPDFWPKECLCVQEDLPLLAPMLGVVLL